MRASLAGDAPVVRVIVWGLLALGFWSVCVLLRAWVQRLTLAWARYMNRRWLRHRGVPQ
jgi:hypothetical protein